MNSKELIAKIKKDLENLSPIMPILAAIVQGAIAQNFEAGGRWDGVGTGLFNGGNKRWDALTEDYQVKLTKLGFHDTNPTLYRSGYLYDMIEVTHNGKDTIKITSGAVYSRVHQLGGTPEQNIPPRPYITLTPSDLDDIVSAIKDYLFN